MGGIAHGHKGPFRGGGNVLKWITVMIVAQLYKYTKNHWGVRLKQVKFYGMYIFLQKIFTHKYLL